MLSNEFFFTSAINLRLKMRDSKKFRVVFTVLQWQN